VYEKVIGITIACVAAMPLIAVAADLEAASQPVPAPVPVVVPATSWWSGTELRAGAFAHGVGSVERNTVDANVELVLPSLFSDKQSWWLLLVPRPYVGGMINASGLTSSVRGGALWHFPLWGGFFAEGFFGGAYAPNGSINGDNIRHAGLGSRTLFNAGGSIGYQFNEHWSLLATFDHLSNGKTIFGTGFNKNQGLNDYGLQLSYIF
jgi:lipid A 3-O-deacylase